MMMAPDQPLGGGGSGFVAITTDDDIAEEEQQPPSQRPQPPNDDNNYYYYNHGPNSIFLTNAGGKQQQQHDDDDGIHNSNNHHHSASIQIMEEDLMEGNNNCNINSSSNGVGGALMTMGYAAGDDDGHRGHYHDDDDDDDRMMMDQYHHHHHQHDESITTTTCALPPSSAGRRRRRGGGQPSQNATRPTPTNRNNMSMSVVVVEPREDDILCGRGAAINMRTGNQRFRALCFARKPEFDAGNLVVRRQIAEEIVLACQTASHARFLKKCKTNTSKQQQQQSDEEEEQQQQQLWVEMTMEQAIRKACQVMRDYKRPDRVALREATAKQNATATNGEDATSRTRRDRKQPSTPRLEDVAPPMMMAVVMNRMESQSTAAQGIVQLDNSNNNSNDAVFVGGTGDGVANIFHEHDILCGRGAFVNGNPGNIRLRQLAIERKEAFDAGSFTEKQALAAEIVAQIRSLDPPGRFLKKRSAASSNDAAASSKKEKDTQNDKKNKEGGLSGEWIELSDDKALHKATQVMRDINRPDRLDRDVKRRTNKRKRGSNNQNNDHPVSPPPPPHNTTYTLPGSLYSARTSTSGMDAAAKMMAEETMMATQAVLNEAKHGHSTGFCEEEMKESLEISNDGGGAFEANIFSGSAVAAAAVVAAVDEEARADDTEESLDNDTESSTTVHV